MLLARQIHNFRSRKLRTFTTFPMDISPPFRPDLYLCDLSRIQMAVIFHILGRPTIIHWSAIPLIIKCICSPVMWSLWYLGYKLVTLGRDECHGFVIKCPKIHFKRLPDLLWMSSEGINMWGNEGGWDWYFNFDLLFGWLDDRRDHSSFCRLPWDHSSSSHCTFGVIEVKRESTFFWISFP